MQSTTEIILEGGRFVRRNITRQDLGSQETILAGFADSSPVFIRNMQLLGSQPIHVLTNRGSITVMTELTKLPFDSNWYFDATRQEMLPLYNSPMEGSVTINDPWVAPAAFGKLIFAVHSLVSPAGTASLRNVYLFRYHGGELYHFPYPNLYDDCRVCMGSNFTRSMSNLINADVMSQYLHVQGSFYETRLNSDLSKTITSRMFCRNIGGEWIYHPDYTPFCGVTSAAFMRGFSL